MVVTLVWRRKKVTNVMIVDDEIDVREMLDLMMQKEGYDTEMAEDGSDFLEKVDSFSPDIVYLGCDDAWANNKGNIREAKEHEKQSKDNTPYRRTIFRRRKKEALKNE